MNPEGTRIEGEFRDGELYGPVVIAPPDGTRMEVEIMEGGEFRGGGLYGPVVMTFPNGTRMEVELRGGEPVFTGN